MQWPVVVLISHLKHFYFRTKPNLNDQIQMAHRYFWNKIFTSKCLPGWTVDTISQLVSFCEVVESSRWTRFRVSIFVTARTVVSHGAAKGVCRVLGTVESLRTCVTSWLSFYVSILPGITWNRGVGSYRAVITCKTKNSLRIWRFHNKQPSRTTIF